MTRIALLIALFAAFPLAGFAQSSGEAEKAVEDPEYLVNVDVGYNTALRSRHWTSVDVQVMNEREDIDGWVEVRLYGLNNELQSPVYRMPGELPNQSRKRFRFNCYLDNTVRVEAWLYDNNMRPLVDVPAYIQLQPIEPKDSLVAILDDDPVRYGFLYAAIQPREGKPVRLHRFNLTSPDFALLPNHVASYSSFDGIIIGAIEPTRMPMEQRKLLHRYVEHGGDLIICTGLFGPNYRDTWIEELAGVSIGNTIETNDGDVARAAFTSELFRSGADAEDHCVIAQLEPLDQETRVLGQSVVLATARPLGRGTVYTLAVDIASGALVNTEGYRRFWEETLRRDPLASNAAGRRSLNYEGVTAEAAGQLPHLAGVTIQSKEFVTIYLALYIGFGVIANWLFWSWRKRREFAWLTLLVVSAGFTAYAVYTGSAGWGRTAQVHQIEVIYMPPGGGPAEYHAATGIFASRTSTFEGRIRADDALIFDGSRAYQSRIGRQRGGFGMPQLVRPFYVDMTEEPRIESFRVGASELRLAQIQGFLPEAGAFTANISHGTDRISGSVKNETGYTFTDLAFVYNGAFFPLHANGPDSWTVDLPSDRIAARRHNNYARIEEWSRTSDHQINSLRSMTVNAMLQGEDSRIVGAGVYDSVNPDLPPMVIGWVDGEHDLAFAPEAATERATSLRLVAAAVNVNYLDRNTRERLGFSVNHGNSYWEPPPPAPTTDARSRLNAVVPGPTDVYVRPTAAWRDDPESTLELQLTWYVDKHPDYPDGIDVMLAQPGDLSRAWHDDHVAKVEDTKLNAVPARKITYLIDDWRPALGAEGNFQFVVLGIEPGHERVTMKDDGTLDMPYVKYSRRPYAFAMLTAAGEYRPGYKIPEGTLPWR